MPGRPEAIHEERCKDHARFMRHLSEGAANGVFWSMFVFVVILLVAVSYSFNEAEKHHRQLRKERLLPGAEMGSSAQKQKHTAAARRCLMVTLVFFACGAVAVSIQTLALLNLQYCHGEDLIFIYTALWALLGIGSTIAFLGVTLNQALSFLGLEDPAYNVAMGTPVLVVAAIGHLCYTLVSNILQSRRDRRSGVENEHREPDQPLIRFGPGLLAQGSIDLNQGPAFQICAGTPGNLPPGAQVTQIKGAENLHVVCFRTIPRNVTSRSTAPCPEKGGSNSSFDSRCTRSIRFEDEQDQSSSRLSGSETSGSRLNDSSSVSASIVEDGLSSAVSHEIEVSPSSSQDTNAEV